MSAGRGAKRNAPVAFAPIIARLRRTNVYATTPSAWNAHRGCAAAADSHDAVRSCVAPILAGVMFLLLLSGGPCEAGEARSPRNIEVGPGHPISRISEAARIARDGDVVVIEPGIYAADVASWPQHNLTLRASRCCARLYADGRSAEGKAIWVLKGSSVLVENIEFEGARVADRNGAGIRYEGRGRLTVRNCRFTGNEIGLLSSNDPSAEVIVEGSEFDHNAIATAHAQGDPVGHQIYVGRIARFAFRDNYVHHGRFGHLVKSRARENFIYDNRLTDESDGRASYELEFPNGGIAYVVGNIIQQSAQTENDTMISFGAERYYWPRNELYLVNNTIVDDRPGLRPVLSVREGDARVTTANNVLIGRGARLRLAEGFSRLDHVAGTGDVASAAAYDFRLRRASPLVGKAVDPGEANGVRLRPEREYVHPRGSRAVGGDLYSPGALQTLAP
jgi:hypothetical protein